MPQEFAGLLVHYDVSLPGDIPIIKVPHENPVLLFGSFCQMFEVGLSASSSWFGQWQTPTTTSLLLLSPLTIHNMEDIKIHHLKWKFQNLKKKRTKTTHLHLAKFVQET